jgi:Na+-transporting NADH:ubiquinone oxidoreductase subunit NqrF
MVCKKMKKARVHHSETIERLQKEIDNSPWHKKLKMWWDLKKWDWTCRTRFIWDLSYEHNIFRRKIK